MDGGMTVWPSEEGRGCEMKWIERNFEKFVTLEKSWFLWKFQSFVFFYGKGKWILAIYYSANVISFQPPLPLSFYFSSTTLFPTPFFPLDFPLKMCREKSLQGLELLSFWRCENIYILITMEFGMKKREGGRREERSAVCCNGQGVNIARW